MATSGLPSVRSLVSISSQVLFTTGYELDENRYHSTVHESQLGFEGVLGASSFGSLPGPAAKRKVYHDEAKLKHREAIMLTWPLRDRTHQIWSWKSSRFLFSDIQSYGDIWSRYCKGYGSMQQLNHVRSKNTSKGRRHTHTPTHTCIIIYTPQMRVSHT